MKRIIIEGYNLKLLFLFKGDNSIWNKFLFHQISIIRHYEVT